MMKLTVCVYLAALFLMLQFLGGVYCHDDSQDADKDENFREDGEEEDEITFFKRKGATYIRWGGTECPSSADTLYNGFIASSHYAHGGTNSYLCLVNDPKFLNIVPGHQAERTWLYGTEFGIVQSPDPAISTKDDVPCVACSAHNNRLTQLMIPGTTECPKFWTLEYDGYLMAGYYGTLGRRKETICVDKNPGKVLGTSAATTTSLLYFVESTCTGIKCAPYSLGAELTCAVCTK